MATPLVDSAGFLDAPTFGSTLDIWMTRRRLFGWVHLRVLQGNGRGTSLRRAPFRGEIGGRAFGPAARSLEVGFLHCRCLRRGPELQGALTRLNSPDWLSGASAHIAIEDLACALERARHFEAL